VLCTQVQNPEETIIKPKIMLNV